MSDVVVFNPGKSVPSFAVDRRERSSLAKRLAGGAGGSMKRLSIKAGVFRLMAGGKEVAAIDDRHLDVVIVAAADAISRTYYAGQYVEGEASGPACWSADGSVPDEKASKPQAASCATCPQNVKGSGQGDARACRFSQRIAVLLASDIEGDVMQMTVPAASLFGKEQGDDRPLQAYARWLDASNIDPEMVVTRMRFDTKASSPKLFFRAARWLNEEEHTVAVEKGQTEDAKRAITMTVAQADGVQDTHAPAPEPILEGKRPTAKKAKPKEETQDVEDAEIVEKEPNVRKGASAPTQVRSETLAKAVSDWDDE